MDVEERVEAGVDAADGAGIDTEDAARARTAMAKMMARLGRASPAVPLGPQAEPMMPKIVPLMMSMALLGWARPAVPSVPQTVLKVLRMFSMPPCTA